MVCDIIELNTTALNRAESRNSMSVQRMEEDHSMIVKCHNCGKESQLEVFHKGDKVLHTTIQCSKCGETIHVLV